MVIIIICNSTFFYRWNWIRNLSTALNISVHWKLLKNLPGCWISLSIAGVIQHSAATAATASAHLASSGHLELYFKSATKDFFLSSSNAREDFNDIISLTQLIQLEVLLIRNKLDIKLYKYNHFFSK